ncbi:MAG TPA: hypothetical protein PKA58_23810 [Polyangium sp.]|jgi:hypothetical protein|nr:hypothetical protein [Polyangium sp.]
MSLSDEEESRVAIAFDGYLAALDRGDPDVLATAAMDRSRQDVRIYRMVRTCMSHIEAIDAHDEGAFVTWSIRSGDGNVVARFSAIVSMLDDRLVVHRLVSRDIDEQALSSAAEVVVSAPVNSLPRSSQYWVRRWEGRPSIAPSAAPPPMSPSAAPPPPSASDSDSKK